MAVRIQTDQTLYLYEDEGDNIFPSTGDWSVLWMYRHESDLNLASLLAVLYGDVAATIYCGAYVGADGVTVTLRGANGGSETTSSQSFVLEVGREYRLSLVHDDTAGTVTLRNDGVPVLSMSFSPAAGDAGFRSLHFAGFGGSPAGHLDSTWARMRIWTAVLTEAEQKAEFRSLTPVRTSDLVNDWPMVPGTDRFDPASGTTQALKIFPTTSIVDGAGFLAGPAEPIYRDSESGGDATLSSPTISVPAPMTQEGDLEVLWISAGRLASAGAAPTITTPSGWTSRGSGGSVPVVGGAVNTRVHLFTRLAPSSNGAVVCDAGVNAVFAYTRLSYPNPDAVTPFGQVTFGNGGPSTSAVLSALTTGRPKSLLSSFITQGAAQSITPPSDMVEREDNATSGCSSHDRIQPAAGSSGSKTFTLPSSTDFAWGFAEFYAEQGATLDSGNNTAQSSWAVSTPALAEGDMLMVHIGWDDSTTISSVTAPAGPNGETAVSIAGPVASASTEVRAQAWRYITTGTWSAGTLTFTPSGGSEQWTATVLKVTAGEFDATTPIGAASTRASSGTAETSALSPAFNAGSTDGGGRLIAWLAADDDPFTTDAGAWTRLANVDRGAVAALLAQRDLPTQDSESLTAGSWAIAGDSWASLAYVIRNSAIGAVDLTIAEASHGHSADNLVLTTSVTLVISDCTHGHATESLTVSTGTSLQIAEAAHGHSAESLTLSTGTFLQIAAAAHGHTADALILTTDSTLAIADSSHAHTAENLTLGVTTGVDLEISDSAHAHSADGLSLTLDTTLAIAEAIHGHSADGLTLTTDQHLEIQGASHSHSAENVVLSDVPTLSIGDAVHGHTADSLSLSADTSLSIADSLHSHTAEQILLSTALSLTIADASHSHTAENLVLSDVPSLAIADARHAHFADSPSFTLDSWLVIADAVHAHLADHLLLTDSNNIWPDGPAPIRFTAYVPARDVRASVPLRDVTAIIPRDRRAIVH